MRERESTHTHTHANTHTNTHTHTHNYRPICSPFHRDYKAKQTSDYKSGGHFVTFRHTNKTQTCNNI